MKNNKNQLIIISGITGAIGNAFLCKYSREKGAVIYGISRKAQPYQRFIDPETEKLSDQSFIASIDDLSDESIGSFVAKIDFEKFESITYVHCVGTFPSEIDLDGKLMVENDNDGDGINDEVMELSHNSFVRMINAIEIAKSSSIKLSAIIFGSIADAHKPMVIQSWWRTKELTVKFMQEKSENIGMHMINVSSVTCSNEMIDRPQVFTKTDADIRYWLLPTELTDRFFKEIDFEKIDMFRGYHEYEIFNVKPNFGINHFENSNFTARRIKEVYG